MNILFRVDSSQAIGIGHIMRDLVLTKEFKESNITFASLDLEGNINHKIKENGFKTIWLENETRVHLVNVLLNNKIDFLVIDSYDIDYEYEKYIKDNTNVIIMVLDDTYERHYCDILLNHNIYADKKRYKQLVPEHCEIRCGREYTLIRSEFVNTKKNSQNNIFIAMGGSDTLNLNIDILKCLTNFLDIKIDIVTTTSNKNIEELKKYVSDKPNITLHIDSKNLAVLMAKSKLAIVSPSVTLNEIFFMDIPFIAIQTADNQVEMVNYLEEEGLPCMREFHLEILKYKVSYLLDNIQMINFTDLTIYEKEIVLDWRNDLKIRKWMHNGESISLSHHLAFIENLEDIQTKKYYLVKKESESIGVVSFINITKYNCEIGIYSNPKLKAKGQYLIETIKAYALKKLKVQTIIAEVFENNKKAISFYERNNFQVVATKEYENKNIIVMEFQDDVR